MNKVINCLEKFSENFLFEYEITSNEDSISIKLEIPNEKTLNDLNRRLLHLGKRDSNRKLIPAEITIEEIRRVFER